jgi:hypothetical protein
MDLCIDTVFREYVAKNIKIKKRDATNQNLQENLRGIIIPKCLSRRIARHLRENV